MYATVDHIAALPVQGIKLQLLHVLKGTDLADYYADDPFHIFTMDEYIEVLTGCLKRLPPSCIVHRMTGDGPKKLLIAPLWSADKKRVINAINSAIRK
jgi:hypothetical protein